MHTQNLLKTMRYNLHLSPGILTYNCKIKGEMGLETVICN